MTRWADVRQRWQALRARRAWRWGMEIVLALAVIFAVRAYLARDVATGPAPAFASHGLQGERLAVADLRGRPAIVHFWATWCRICKAEQGTIQALAADHAIVTVAMQSGDRRTVADYVQKEAWRVPVAVDEDGALARAYGVRGVPTTFVLDRHGNIRFVEIGYTTEIGLRLRLWWAGRAWAEPSTKENPPVGDRRVGAPPR